MKLKETLGEGCGGLDGVKCLEFGTNNQRDLGGRMWRTGPGQVSGDWDQQPKRPWGKDVEDWTGSSVWRLGPTTKETLGEGCGGLDRVKCLEIGTNNQRDLGEGCGGLDRVKCLEIGTNNQRDLGGRMWRTGRVKCLEIGMNNQRDLGGRMWRTGRVKCLEIGMNNQRDLGGRMWRTGRGQVSGDWDKQPKIPWGKDVEDWTGSSVWRLGRTAEDRLMYTRSIKVETSKMDKKATLRTIVVLLESENAAERRDPFVHDALRVGGEVVDAVVTLVLGAQREQVRVERGVE